jgi:hypothetical protein
VDAAGDERERGTKEDAVIRALAIMIVTAFALADAGCFRTPGQVVPPSEARATDLTAATATAPAGELALALVDEVGTDVSVEGDTFRGRLVRAIVDEHGEVIAKRGALVHGVVCMVRTGRAPALALDVTTVETTKGPAVVHGWLRGAQAFAMPEVGTVYNPRESPYDVMLSAWYLPGPLAVMGPPAGILYYPGASGSPVDLAGGERIHLPVGTEIVMELGRPLSYEHFAPCGRGK